MTFALLPSRDLVLIRAEKCPSAPNLRSRVIMVIGLAVSTKVLNTSVNVYAYDLKLGTKAVIFTTRVFASNT